ncbi:hypothetical protein [Spiroplasma endosymbiont of Dilophus febrilis]|uniref:hypothetical protein n=1 Tax=Spiroplasma endosymbiont of Dilophus febrilis TaxID=3066292 RepID=UPI00313D554B
MLFFQNYSNLYPPNKTLCALYRSLITFYPKKYLINVTGNSELLLRSYFFTFDKKTHQENYSAFKNNNSIYKIDFNVLKSYDNKLISLPISKTDKW